MDCPYALAGNCQVSSFLAGIDVPLSPGACRACQGSAVPMGENTVTVARAMWARTQQKQPFDPVLMDYFRELSKQGPGTEFKRLLDHKLKLLSRVPLLASRVEALGPDTCGCRQMQASMNAWGPAMCEIRRDQILDHTVANAQKVLPLPALLLRRQLSRLLDKALAPWRKP